jgi:iron complex outermembrane receptor protein
VQADISLLGASACGPGGRAALSGSYTLAEALGRVLAGAPCTFRIVDARTVRITAVAPAPRVVGPATPVVAELLVTARKRPERLDTLPAGVSVISGEQIVATNAYDVRETAGQLVSVLSTNLGPGRDKLLMRGLSDGAFTGRARSTVSTYLDDTPINYNAPDPDLRLFDVERVETVRGPQGALYGSGALAGVYRIVTNKPDPSGYAGALQLTASTTKGGSASYEADGYVNVPLAGGRAALRLVGYTDDQGGYLDNLSLRASNVDTTARNGGRLALRAGLGDRWTLDLLAAGQHLTSNDTQYTTLTATKTKKANQVREASDNTFAQGAATLHGDLGWASVTASASYVQHDYDSLYDATAAASQFSQTGAALGIYSEGARIRRGVQDVVVTSVGSGPVSWLAGVYASESVERTPSSLAISPASSTAVVAAPQPPVTLIQVYNEQRRDRMHELAVYGEGTWRFAPGWTLAAGARAFESTLDVAAQIVGAPPAQSRDVAEKRNFSGVSPKLSVQYQFDDEGPLVYGLYSEGFRPGGVNSTNFLTPRLSRQTFEPDRLGNFEFGAKGHFLDRHLVIRAAAFYDLWSNIQSDEYRPSGLAFTANVGDAHIQGLEAETAYDWAFGLSVKAHMLYSEPRFTRLNPDFIGVIGSGLPGAPKFSGGLLVRYDRPLPYDLTLRLTGEANYVGPTRLTFDPTLSARTDPVVDAVILAEVAARHWSAGFFVSNPADASSNTFAYGNPFTFGQVRQVTPQRPRTVGVRVAAAF